jgi:cytochrome c5
MKILRHIFLGLLILVAVPVFPQTDSNVTASAHPAQQQANVNVVHGAKERDGNEVFAQNCSRCHNAPEGFSPRIAGTVARHMRVRAGLSKEDEQAILRFLNP